MTHVRTNLILKQRASSICNQSKQHVEFEHLQFVESSAVSALHMNASLVGLSTLPHPVSALLRILLCQSCMRPNSSLTSMCTHLICLSFHWQPHSSIHAMIAHDNQLTEATLHAHKERLGDYVILMISYRQHTTLGSLNCVRLCCDSQKHTLSASFSLCRSSVWDIFFSLTLGHVQM